MSESDVSVHKELIAQINDVGRAMAIEHDDLTPLRELAKHLGSVALSESSTIAFIFGMLGEIVKDFAEAMDSDAANEPQTAATRESGIQTFGLHLMRFVSLLGASWTLRTPFATLAAMSRCTQEYIQRMRDRKLIWCPRCNAAVFPTSLLLYPNTETGEESTLFR